MRWFFRLFLFSILLFSPCLFGCSSQLSEEETPIVASDEDEPAETANDPENP